MACEKACAKLIKRMFIWNGRRMSAKACVKPKIRINLAALIHAQTAYQLWYQFIKYR